MAVARLYHRGRHEICQRNADPEPPSANNLVNELGLGSNPLNGVQVFGGGTTFENYVPGQTCFAPGFNPNIHYNPETTLALNPNAWQDVPAGVFGVSSPY